ncbi:MAG: polyphosphate polymerase domain-containing protein [Kiritimatiellaeota bacterium]|nr:polyphosphate polymerase domain-containing protein [Kiritimatiellota bacterium]
MSGSGQVEIVNRYESKYLIPPALMPEVRAHIAPFTVPDRFCRGDPPEYSITTLQLDTPSFAFHYAKELEQDDRFKLRVRTYGKIGSAPVFTEIKGKFQDIVVKARAMLPFEAWGEQLIFSTDLPGIFRSRRQENDFLEFRRLVWETGAQPAIVVRYVRESYVGTGRDYLRVTFDRKLEYCPRATWTSFGAGESWYPMDSSEDQAEDDSCIVLEVKTLQDVPVWVVDMVERLNLQRGGNCKYSTGMWKDALFSRMTPPREGAMDFLAWSV